MRYLRRNSIGFAAADTSPSRVIGPSFRVCKQRDCHGFHTCASIAGVQVMKELLQQIFVTPKGHHKSKPFFDHVLSFTYCDNRIWLRNYQVVVALDKKKVTKESVTLVEVGPRVTLQPIKVCSCVLWLRLCSGTDVSDLVLWLRA